MKNVIGLIVLLISGLAVAQTNIRPKIPSGKASLDLKGVVVKGSGCDGFVNARVYEDGSWLLIQPANFINILDENGGLSVKNCGISANITYDGANAGESYQYRVEEIYLPYNVSLAKDVNLNFSVMTFIQGFASQSATEKISLVGKQKAYGYLVTEHSSMGWSKCGGGRSLTANINTMMSQDNSKALGSLAVAASSPIYFRLAWQSCTP